MDLSPGNDYSIKISSATDTDLSDQSDQPFKIDVPRIIAMRQLQGGAWVLEWAGTSAGVFIEFSPTPEAEQWQTIGGPVSGSVWTNAPQVTPEGFYRLRLE